MISLRADKIHTDMLSLIGKISVQWTHLDFLLGELLGGFKGLDAKKRGQDIHWLYTSDKIKQIRSLVETTLTDEKEKTSLLALITEIDELSKDRNYVIHGLIHYKAPDAKSPSYIKVFRGKYRDEQKPFSKETLDPILSEINKLCDSMFTECDHRGYLAKESHDDEAAKALFDARPSNHPQCPPKWEDQPEYIKDVFRKLARGETAT
jgi:hypothetical protein